MQATLNKTTEDAMNQAIFNVLAWMQAESDKGHTKNVKTLERHLTALCDEINYLHDQYGMATK